MTDTLRLRRLDPRAVVPTRATETDAGLDLCALEDVTIWPGQRVLVRTGWAMAVPDGHYGRIAPRSGLAWKHGLDVLAGVVDASYRGEIQAVLFNTTSLGDPVEILAGHKVAQLILERISILPVEVVDELDPTVRGEGGWGSTGA